ncbi:hypothetical protein AO385_0330 [Moraxella catarrhalis]|uniref:Uncharacterized protein n=1 Tax=Moraxella catarrhalis TaxID=480 RepID=A0A198UG93_MORCA|nr:hypothetical protein AO384_1622 [Moraxella catarrhalis]OAV03823.1 hypothetical protein AO385_0330 [Moraxella catarrhalis]
MTIISKQPTKQPNETPKKSCHHAGFFDWVILPRLCQSG